MSKCIFYKPVTLNITNRFNDNDLKKNKFKKHRQKYGKLKTNFFNKLYVMNTECHENTTNYSKNAGLDVYINYTNQEINKRFAHIFDMKTINVNKFMDIVLLQINITFLQHYFSTSDYNNDDKKDFYNFLVIINDILNDINNVDDDINI